MRNFCFEWKPEPSAIPLNVKFTEYVSVCIPKMLCQRGPETMWNKDFAGAKDFFGFALKRGEIVKASTAGEEEL